MGLPTNREETAVAAAPVKPNTINVIQDCIIGSKFPAEWRWFMPTRGWVETNITFDASGGIGSGDAKANANTAQLTCAPWGALPPGVLVSGLKCRFKGTGGAGTVHIYLQRNQGDSSFSNLGDLAIVDPPNNWATYTLDPIGTQWTVEELKAMYLSIHMPLANQACGPVAIKVSRL